MGKNRDMQITIDPIPRLLIKIAVPSSIGYFFNTMYNLVDTYFGGRISTESLAALSLSFPVFLLFLAFGIGISSGAGALIANAIGAGKEEKARQYQTQAISYAAIVSVVASVIILLVLRPIFQLIGADETTIEPAMRYARILVAGSVFFVLNYTVNAGLTSRGDTRSYRNVLIIGFLLNIGLDPLLLYGLKIGGATIIPAMYEGGIALATILIQIVSLVYLVRKSVRKGILSNAKIREFVPRRAVYREITGQAVPSTLNMMTMALGTFVITYFVARFGTGAVAAYGAAIRIEQIVLIPTIGLNVALATLIGQNNGAGRLDRVQESFKMSLLFGVVIMVGVLTPVLIFARPLIRIFTAEEEVVRIGMAYIYIEAITFYSYIALHQSNAVLQGLKRPAMIMWVGLYRQIPAPLLFFSLFALVLGLGVNGVWWGLAVVNWSAAVFVVLYARHLVRKKNTSRMPQAA